jgi:hypothetical protein
MKESLQDGGAAFDSESISRTELASISALIADRDAHMEKAAQLARKVFVQVVSFDELDQICQGDPTGLLTHTSSEDLPTKEEFALAEMCIKNMRELKAELQEGIKVQHKINGHDEYDDNPNHFPDKKMARKLLVACSIHLILDDREETDLIDYADTMIAQTVQEQKSDKLYCEIAFKSVKLLRECLTLFIKACDLQETNKYKKID